MEINNLEILGKVLTSIEIDRNTDEIYFTCSDGSEYCMAHYQSCCESVTIEDINGDVNDIIGSTILVAEERISEKDTDYGSETYTFYTLRTINGSIDIRWYGSSNGYYSESVSFFKRGFNYDCEVTRWA
jgi:hypothetical protein